MQTFADRATEQSKLLTNSRLIDACAIVGGSLLMALCAHVSIPLWFTPVPITLQTFGVMLLALTLGGWRSAAAMVLYLIEGASGFPVFSPHGFGGAAQLIGPTGGFLFSYPFAAFVGGLIAHKMLQRSRVFAFAAGALATEFIIFLFGATWLGLLSHQPVRAILIAAVLPFLPGEVLKGIGAITLALGKSLRARQA
ncbi:MAG TPA: biotin transporter BioY [Terriglobales bacterium]|nr:biotin transporter BioY [Terriglobales bacterium]